MAASKRKKLEQWREEGPRAPFSVLTDEIILRMTDFLAPVDVHSLCLASRRFCEPSPVCGVGTRAFASTMLHSSLLCGLERTLKSGMTNFNSSGIVESFRKLSLSLPENSVAISGSTLVQSVLGELWPESDINMCCSRDAAERVRTWLMLEANQMLAGWRKWHGFLVPGHVLDENDKFVSHVERYTNAPVEGVLCRCKCGHSVQFGRESTVLCSEVTLAGNEVSAATDDDDGESIPRIKAMDGVPLRCHPALFDRRRREPPKKCVNIDLMVAKPGVSASQVIDNFDISICKISFDGRRFSIPDPPLTFDRRAELNGVGRSGLIGSYVRCMTRQTEGDLKAILSEFGIRQDSHPPHVLHNTRHPSDVFAEQHDNSHFVAKLRKGLIRRALLQALAQTDRTRRALHWSDADLVRHHNRLLVPCLRRLHKYQHGRRIKFDNIPDLPSHVTRTLPNESESDDSDSDYEEEDSISTSTSTTSSSGAFMEAVIPL